MAIPRLLFVDDEAETKKLVDQYLKLSKENYEIVFANSGQEAIEILQKSEPFDLLITDLKMPGTDHAIAALDESGYDSTLVLPKPKYNKQEVIQENTELKCKNQELELKNIKLKAELEQIQQQTIDLPIVQEEVELEKEELDIEDSTVSELLAVSDHEEAIATVSEIDNIETKSEIKTLKDLKGYNAIAPFDGILKSGTLGSQNGTKHTVQFKKAEDRKIYTFDFSEVQVEYGDRFHNLNDLIEEHNLTVEERNAEELRLDLEDRKAQKMVETTKGFGFSSTTRTHSPKNKSDKLRKGFSPVGKRMGAR
ncbi:response regulator [Chroococcus sp. FPU101]|uniref:response regulator n=1 Tax=Chroococcus sp. FPU101 TaxID=1974212 RepID=UPI001A8EEBFF|nr:response regulator [Chroococcus sp. FPU101]GFE71823.1 hypothetical protein CFPU101_44330 [Chroococcus sp. FPU101]